MDLMSAELVYDYLGDDIHLPERMLAENSSRADAEALGQLQGTVGEKLCESAGRICYDSIGAKRSRPSSEYHAHILEVKHGSVLEHFNFTVEFAVNAITLSKMLLALVNRPGIWSEHRVKDNGKQSLRITVNLRALVEWHYWDDVPAFAVEQSQTLGAVLRHLSAEIAPNIVVLAESDQAAADQVKIFNASFKPQIVKPETQNEKWVTMLLTGSRGFSHELVRHGDWTAISQRSTRFVDEDGSPYVTHPLTAMFLKENIDTDQGNALVSQIAKSVEADQETYRQIVQNLQPWLKDKGIGGLASRKQARGAGRGYLGNALYTEVIFSASVKQWHRILNQRASWFADAEIREVACQVIGELQKSQYANEFSAWSLIDSEDGIGKAGVKS